MRNAVIIDAVRTASGRGKTGGALASVHPVDLLATVLRGVVGRNDIDPATIDDVIAGCVSQVGEQAVNIGRNAVLAAGLPESVPGTTVDRQCGSSQQAVHFAAQGVLAGAYDVVIAAGVESMSRVPMFSNTAGKNPYGPGIRARYPRGLIKQGIAAEVIAARWKLDRDMLDEFSATSHQRAAAAAAAGMFDSEIIAVPIEGVGDHVQDETVRPSTTPATLAGLTPSFVDEDMAVRYPEIDWSITPGNSSPLTDGASAVLIMSEERATELGLRPRARFVEFAVCGDDPELMLTAPIPATARVLRRAGLSLDDMDTYEVNEAFASVPLMWAREVGADLERLNPRGGAIALGHALGSSGTRLLGTLVNHLEATGGRYGLQTLCEAGGLANALIIERL